MKKFLTKTLVTIDLWLVIITATVYISLYAAKIYFDANALGIIFTLFILFNIAYLSTLLIVSSNKDKLIEKKEKNY
jgi:hypothetical protein